MSRAVSDLTDDEIVDAIASNGLSGVNWSPDADGEDRGVLTLLGIDYSDDARYALRERIAELRDAGPVPRLRWCDGPECYILGLSHAEWAKRLAHRTADEIRKILWGAP